MRKRLISFILCHVSIVVCLIMLSFPQDIEAKRKKTPTARDSIQLKIDSLQAVFAKTKTQYDAENEKAYLKQKYDTAALFRHTHSLFLIAEQLDSIDVKKNNTSPRYRRKNSDLLDTYRRNLYNGGNFFLRKNKNTDALRYYDAYIDCGSQPLFLSKDYVKTDSLMPQVAFWAVVSASLAKDYNSVLKHSDLAMRWVRQEQVLQLKANAYKALATDSADAEKQYLATLKQGFLEYPEYTFFFNQMMEYYNDREMFDDAMAVCNDALSEKYIDTSLRKAALFAKASILLQQKLWTECISVCELLIVVDSTFPTPYYYLGMCYYNQAEPLLRKDKKEKKARLNLARKYLETYKDLAPKEKKKWAPLLYKVYYDLNLGKHFKEMDGEL